MSADERKKSDENFSLLLSSIGKQPMTPDAEFLEQLRERSAEQFQAAALAGSERSHLFPCIVSVWRTIMRSRITKLATAATIIVAVLVGLHVVGPFGATVTFAQVVEPILKARTIVLDVVVGNKETGPVMHEILVDSRIRRTFSNMPHTVKIIDVDNTRMLVLHTDIKTASYVELEDVEDDMKFLRQAIMRLPDRPRTEDLGLRQIDGKEAVGFAVGPPKHRITIWADPDTALPIRVELVFGRLPVLLKNFEFNVPIDPSLVSMEVPPGYTLVPAEQDSRRGR